MWTTHIRSARYLYEGVCPKCANAIISEEMFGFEELSAQKPEVGVPSDPSQSTDFSDGFRQEFTTEIRYIYPGRTYAAVPQ